MIMLSLYSSLTLKRLFSSTSTLKPSSISRSNSLYRRISPIGDPRVSIVPVLDQWVREGRPIHRQQLQSIIRELKLYKRFKHALEVSYWMTDRRYFPPSMADVATRINLISRVHGLEQVENYFNNSIPHRLKGFDVYTALLNCYAHEKSVQKAESLMQELRDMGFAKTPLSYNILMNLYYQIGNNEKLDELMHEMEEKGYYDSYTFTIRLSAYAASSDTKGIDNIVTRMESDPKITLDCSSFAIATDGYLKVGLRDEALEMLKKLEAHIETAKRRNVAFNFLLKLYAEAGEKDELYRIWSMYKEKEKIYNKGYIAMMSSLLKFDDIEGAEKIFEEWESQRLSYDFRIPNFLIDAYCKKGLLGKAEALVDKGIAKGGDPLVNTWCYLAGGYLEDDQVPKAVEALKKATMVYQPSSNPNKETLVACLEYLEGKGDGEQAEEFISLLRNEGVFSAAVHYKLLNRIKDKK